MNRAAPILALLLLGLSAWRVHHVRGRLAHEDADPAVVAELSAALEGLPRVLADGRYRGEPYDVPADIVAASGADKYASLTYTGQDGATFRLYIGGAIRNQENFHAPSYCMPASGWEMLEDSTVPFAAYPAPGHPRMRRLVLQYGSQRMLVYYWFQAGARLADHEWTIRWYRLLDLLRGDPLRPTLIVTLYVPVRGSLAETEERTARFLTALGPYLGAAFQLGDRS